MDALVASAGFIPLGLGLSLMQAGVPLMGYVTILGLVIITLGISLWALEGPVATTYILKKKLINFLI